VFITSHDRVAPIVTAGRIEIASQQPLPLALFWRHQLRTLEPLWLEGEIPLYARVAAPEPSSPVEVLGEPDP
jgi:hypothetical protein